MGRKISHICFVEYGYPHIHGGGGGAGTYVKLIAKELVHRGYKVSVITSICKQCPETFDDEGIQVYRYASYGKFHWYLSKIPFIRNIAIPVRYLEYGWSVFRFLENLNKHEPVDLVEFSEGGDFWHAFIHRLPYIAHLHGSAYTFSQQSGRKVGLGRLLERKLELLFIRKASAIFFPL